MSLYGSLSYIVGQKMLIFKVNKDASDSQMWGSTSLTVSFPCFILSKIHRIIIHAPYLSLETVTAAMKLKDFCSLKEKL